MVQSVCLESSGAAGPRLLFVSTPQQLPHFLTPDGLAVFLHEHMKPYQDTLADTLRGIEDALTDRPAPGGFVLLACAESRPVGALVMLGTGMRGYVSEHLLLFVAVDRRWRGRGLGAELVRRAAARCEGDIKLHVEHDNPAKRLYERLGFCSKYEDMRLTRRRAP